MNKKIRITGTRKHLKASEEYVDVQFSYGREIWEGSIPVVYRRTGLELRTDEAISEHLDAAYIACAPEARAKWTKEQKEFWADKERAHVTREFFDTLLSFLWSCVGCTLPTSPNWARRTQDIKEFGYTLSTDTARICTHCKGRKTHILLVPLPRGGETGYETWSTALRKKIISSLAGYDAYEGKSGHHLLPDHKFPEIRWDNETRRESIEHLNDADILRDFQLLSNQRNQQKREVCRSCAQTGKRGYPFGIKFYYSGNEQWPKDIPNTGKEAEKGCFGCGWYDLEMWRRSAIQKIGT